ncbi:MAG TPA: addiction module protein [Bacteroidia bacterium]|nr:addiction module protein [Bacteroidia bacterium]
MELSVIEKEALQLPDTERAMLADSLLASLDKSPDLRRKWSEEVEDRVAAYRRGDIEAVDGPQAMASLRARFRR